MPPLSIHQYRNGLSKTLKAIERGTLRVGFIGGSITAETGYTWPEAVLGWLGHTFPNVRLYAEKQLVISPDRADAIAALARAHAEAGLDAAPPSKP